jgi:hypothetical protein
MEPLSTIAFITTLSLSLPATAKPNWNIEKAKKTEKVATSIISVEHYNNAPAEQATIAELRIPIGNKIQGKTSATDVFSKLSSYSKLQPDWDGADSKVPSITDVKLAIDFVESIPAIFPLPKPMLSREGVIGLYWDDGSVYIDIQFDSEHTLSVFSRDRSSGKEKFVDSVDITSIDSNWYYDTLDMLLTPVGHVQAA